MSQMTPQQAMIAQAQQEAKSQLMQAKKRREKVKTQIPKYDGWITKMKATLPKEGELVSGRAATVSELALFSMVSVYAEHLEDQSISLKEELAVLDTFISRLESPISRVGLT